MSKTSLFMGPVANNTSTKTKEKTKLDAVWQVVVFNDPVNLMSYVTYIFQRTFQISLQKAQKHMLEVHHLGRSVVWAGGKEKAEHFVHLLHQWQLTAMIEKQDA